MKQTVNEWANAVLARTGHSSAMMRETKREAWWWLKARGQALSKRAPLFAGVGIVWTDAGRAELLPLEVPAAGPGEVTIEVLTSVVSPGTERAQFLRLPNASVKYPYLPGYSAAGVVVSVGAGVSHVSRGDVVAGIGIPHCSVATVSARFVYRLPPGLAPKSAALLAPGLVAMQGLRRASIKAGEPLCVLGAGLIGAMTQRLALAAGYSSVTVLATTRSKERLARRAGGLFLVTGMDDDEIAALEAPIVIEATGDPNALSVAAAAAGERGRIVLLGSPRGSTADLPLEALRTKRLEVVGAHLSTLLEEGERVGIDLYGAEARKFLQSAADGRIAVEDLLETAVDPREAGLFYRMLPRTRELVTARFDWTRLPREERLRHARLLRLPTLTGSGLEFRRRPLQAGRLRSRPLIELDDPFAGATGRLRVGLVGCGDIAVHNAAALNAAPNTELVACYDPVSALAEELARRYGAVTTQTAEALFERQDVDAVCLSVPHHLHAPLALQAVAHGLNVIVEKPLANNLASAVEIVSAAERAGVVLTVSFPHRYQPQVIAARRLIDDGALGRVVGSFVRFLADRPPAYWVGGFSGRSPSVWRRSREQAGGGVLITNLSHYIDLVRYLAGVEADWVLAATANVEEPAEVEDTISATIRYENGAMGSLFGSTVVRGTLEGLYSTEVSVWGANGYLVLDRDPQVWSLRAVDGVRPSRWQRFGRLPPSDIRAVFVSRFATAIDQRMAPDVTGADALAVQAFIEAAYRSSELGRGVRPTDLLAEAAA